MQAVSRLYAEPKVHRVFSEDTVLLWEKTISKVEEDVYDLTVDALKYYCTFIPYIGGGIKVAIGVDDGLGHFQQISEIKLGIPTVYEGNYYRMTMKQTYYYWIFEEKMWFTKDAYIRGDDCYYSETVRFKVAVF